MDKLLIRKQRMVKTLRYRLLIDRRKMTPREEEKLLKPGDVAQPRYTGLHLFPYPTPYN